MSTKPGFIILVIIVIILAWATLQASFSGIGTNERESERSTTTAETRAPRTGSARGHQSDIDTYGRTLSPYAGEVTLRAGRARNDEPKEEYMEIRADRKNTRDITITGWRLESIAHGRNITIGNAARILPFRRDTVANDAVVLKPSDRAYVVSGTSPRNISFQTNTCIGYLAEYNTFTPRLARDCPNPEDEDLEMFGIDSDPRKIDNDYQCIQELERIGRCENPGKPDDDLSRDCREYIDQIGYELCVELHREDADFLGSEWYLYHGALSFDIWDDDNEIILLLDQSGRVVDSITY